MGMAASQVRLLQLTSRKNNIGFQLTQLSNEKVTLSRDMQKVARDYQNSLNQKVLKWSNNSGVTYTDLSYANLMKPSSMNKNVPYLITDNSGRVVLDSTYAKYAEMISASGASGGNWDAVRTDVIASLTGLDPEKIENANSSQQIVWKNEKALNNLIEEEKSKPTVETYADDLFAKLGNSTGLSNGYKVDWAAGYSGNGLCNLGNGSCASGNLKTILNHILGTLAPYLEDPENFKTACETAYAEFSGIISNPNSVNNQQSLASNQTALFNINGGYTLNIKLFIDFLMGCYSQESDNCTSKDAAGKTRYTWVDIDSKDYKEWKPKHDEWQKKYDTAKAEYDKSVIDKNLLFTEEEDSLIRFYDKIFSAVAEKGWVANYQVNDTDYLNQMLQNNIYTMTTVDRDVEFDNNAKEYGLVNNYETDIASNFTNIFTVNDSDAQEEALVEYEYKKSIINQKETRIDTRMKDLETEQSAINQMIQGLEKVKNDNIERTMNTMA